MPHENDMVRLRHILEAANDAVSFTQGKNRSSLDIDKMLTHSLVRCVEIIGEAASKLSSDCRNEYPQFLWSQIINMRNRLIHCLLRCQSGYLVEHG